MRNLVKVIREKGDRGIIHRLRGRPSNRRLPEEMRGRVLSLYQESYPDFGPTLAVEKLFECDGITISDETLRTWLRSICPAIINDSRCVRPMRPMSM